MSKIIQLRVIILSLLILLGGCQANPFGDCQEQEGFVTPGCLYNGNYPSCDLNEEDYLIAQKNAWDVPGAMFSSDIFENTGKSQDLGDVCRFYVYVKSDVGFIPAEPYQWMVYVNKSDLTATHYEPVLW